MCCKLLLPFQKPKKKARKYGGYYESDEDSEDQEEEESASESSSSSSSESESESAYPKRSTRQRANISYRFQEFDELINSAIQDDVKVEEPPGTSQSSAATYQGLGLNIRTKCPKWDTPISSTITNVKVGLGLTWYFEAWDWHHHYFDTDPSAMPKHHFEVFFF